MDRHERGNLEQILKSFEVIEKNKDRLSEEEWEAIVARKEEAEKKLKEAGFL